MLRISKGVTSFFLFLELKYKIITQTIEHKTTKENRAPKIISYLYLKLGVKNSKLVAFFNAPTVRMQIKQPYTQ